MKVTSIFALILLSNLSFLSVVFAQEEEAVDASIDETTETNVDDAPPAAKLEEPEQQQEQEPQQPEETEKPKAEEPPKQQQAPTSAKARRPEIKEFNVQTHTDWGSYYDPQNIFCGLFDCYQILGFDFESFGSNVPDTKVITKRYRALSRVWHPDKSKHKDAKERFVKIARAYEVLTNTQKRAEYDFMRYNQEAYYQKYGANVLWSYAPKSDASFIVLLLFIAANYFTFVAQKHRWQMVADRLVKASMEDWTASQGGTQESKEMRERALKELEGQQKVESADEDGSTKTGATPAKVSNKKIKNKLSGKEKKQQQSLLIKPILMKYVEEIDDFGAGFHKPTWKDLFVVRMAKFPITIASGMTWQLKYAIRRLQKQELNDEEKEVLTERAVGYVSWDLASDDEHKAMIARKLWIKENLLEFKEEQEIKNLSKSDQKQINKMRKKGIKAE